MLSKHMKDQLHHLSKKYESNINERPLLTRQNDYSQMKTVGLPGGGVVNFVHSASRARGFTGSRPGCGPNTAHQAMLRWSPT